MPHMTRCILALGWILFAGGCGKDICKHDGQTYDRGETRWEPVCEGDSGLANECTCLPDGGWECTDLGASCGTTSP